MRIATDALLTEYWNSIYAAAYNVTGNKMDAEDAAQDAFIRYHMSRKEFDSKEHIRAWLFKVTINRAKDLTRGFWKRNKVSFDDYMKVQDEAAGVCNDLIQKDETNDLMEALFSIPEKLRIVIHLYYYEDYQCDEIAKIVDISQEAVRKRLSRAREMLKKKLSEEWKDD